MRGVRWRGLHEGLVGCSVGESPVSCALGRGERDGRTYERKPTRQERRSRNPLFLPTRVRGSTRGGSRLLQFGPLRQSGKEGRGARWRGSRECCPSDSSWGAVSPHTRGSANASRSERRERKRTDEVHFALTPPVPSVHQLHPQSRSANNVQQSRPFGLPSLLAVITRAPLCPITLRIACTSA